MNGIRRVLVTGGAGFVGSNLAVLLRRGHPDVEVVAFDNLCRRGSEFNLPRLAAVGAEFVHGDVRLPDDLARAGDFDVLIDCAAEPSVSAGLNSSPRTVFDVNLNGTINSLEAARERDAAFLLLSTSRVYPIAAVNDVPFEETSTRFRWTNDATTHGVSERGIAEDFPLHGTRSYYGASKLSSELIAQEYAALAGMPVMINRCGVLSGPWQMARADQGVIALWTLRHHLGRPLKYIGYGGEGKQVRDVLHVEDLYDLVVEQLESLGTWDGRVYNVGGGPETSVSLLELTDVCRDVTGQTIPIGRQPETSSVDLRIYLTDTRRVTSDFSWTPRRSVSDVVADVHRWAIAHEDLVRTVV